MASNWGESQWYRGYSNMQQNGESHPMLPPQDARLPRDPSNGSHRLPRSTPPRSASSPYASQWVYNQYSPEPTYSPLPSLVGNLQDYPPSEYHQHTPSQSDFTSGTSQRQRRRPERGDNTQQAYSSLHSAPEAHDFRPPPVPSATRQELHNHVHSYAGHGDGQYQRSGDVSISNASGPEDTPGPMPNHSRTSLHPATEDHATESRRPYLQIPFRKRHPEERTRVSGTEINDVTQPQDEENPYLLEANNWLNRVVKKLGLKEKLQWMDSDFFHENAWFSWSTPHSHQLPGRYYSITSEGERDKKKKSKPKHLDVFRREHEGVEDDRYLDPVDGRVQELVVQSTKRTYNQRNNTTWRRTYMKNVSPYIIRLAYWPVSSVPSSQQSSEIAHDQEIHDFTEMASWNKEQWAHFVVRWLPTCIGLLIMMIFPTDVEGQIRNNGYYDPFPYRFWSYAKSATNPHEQAPAPPASKTTLHGQAPDPSALTTTFPHRQVPVVPPLTRNPRGQAPVSPALKESNPQQNMLISTKRSLRPDFLCFLDAKDSNPPYGKLDPEAWKTARGIDEDPGYVFISFTSFQFDRKSEEDTQALHLMAREAASQAKVPAYWTEICMPQEPDKFRASVYRICDVVRGAHSVAIVVGQTGKDTLDPEVTIDQLLREWGTKMWTLPEVLLAPLKKRIYVYRRGTDLKKPLKLTKTVFPYRVWEDGELIRSLVDHYENTLVLSRLELPIIALRCLKDRAAIDKKKPFAAGDLSYALMGLLRQRPNVDVTDTAFQAFARLSLANDSDKLLERMICLLPKRMEQVGTHDQTGRLGTNAMDVTSGATQKENVDRHWFANMADVWDAQLWDIDPICQICAIAENDTVVIDGAFAAAVHWDSFQRVAITTKETWTRMMSRGYVRGIPGWFGMGTLLVALGKNNPTLTGIGAMFLIIAIVGVFLSPFLILHVYGGKIWNTQPWLFGFEGHMDIDEIEMMIFGFPAGRLSWTPYGSSLSRHQLKTKFLARECEGCDPFKENEGDSGKALPQNRLMQDGKMKIFTLVDTNTMTVTLFEAERPPVVALLCGSEGGMQRAVMCSYDWPTQTLYRETVLRMETKVLEKISRIGRVRFGLQRRQKELKTSVMRPP